MELNADFSQRVLVDSAALDWTSSPMAGVSRRMLDRLGGEVARATTIVRYDPDSSFSPHIHTGGEEFVVLSGVFSDEHGDFPAGSYIRNPPQSRHTPGSAPGCVIFVKLWQFDLADRTHVRVDYTKMGRLPDASRPGVEITPLYADERETVQIEYWQPGAQVTIDAPQGAELLVLAGGASETGETLREHSWLRLPMHSSGRAVAGPEGATVWIKTGHLPFVAPPPGV